MYKTIMFKMKKIKKSNVDVDYNNQCKQMSVDAQQILKLHKKLQQLNTKYEELSKKKSSLSPDETNNMYQTRNECNQLIRELNNYKQNNNITNFFLNTGELVADYYDDNTTNATTSTPITPTNNQICTNNNDILQYFGTSPNNSKHRADIYDKYLNCTDPHHLAETEYNKNEDICPNCGIARELIAQDAIMVCPQCGNEVPMILESDKPSYHDPPHENTYFAYKKINHFKEQLSHFQAKETTKIPQEVYDIILIEMKKEKRNNLATINKTQIKRYLQKYAHLGYNKYYENINQIICHLNGMTPIIIKPELEEKLCNMFLQIQEPFEKYKPSDRNNFISYSYVIYKFFQILGYFEYLQYFNLLKSKEKLRKQDIIWKKICQDVGWKFYPS